MTSPVVPADSTLRRATVIGPNEGVRTVPVVRLIAHRGWSRRWEAYPEEARAADAQESRLVPAPPAREDGRMETVIIALMVIGSIVVIFGIVFFLVAAVLPTRAPRADRRGRGGRPAARTR